jgi:hypothetical protein
MVLYINDEQIAYGGAPFTSLTSVEYTHDEVNIGDHWTDVSYPYTFDGRIDEVRISDIARYEIVSIDDEQDELLPRRVNLSQNYPNPFNSSTIIQYTLPKASEVKITLYDILGRKIATLQNGRQVAGNHSLIWNADAASSGIYFYGLQAGDYSETRKMILLR